MNAAEDETDEIFEEWMILMDTESCAQKQVKALDVKYKLIDILTRFIRTLRSEQKEIWEKQYSA